MKEVIAKIYNVEGKEVGQEKLPAQVFAVDIKPEVVQQVVVAQLANARVAIAHTKGRGEVRGGGKKPWRQKGTGRARHGSSRSPIWVGGGITFGPTKDRNFSKYVNKKVRQKALRMVLSDKAANEHIILLEALEIPEAKTKLLSQLLAKLPSKGKKVMLVTDSSHVAVARAARNLAKAQTMSVNSLNVVDLLNYEYIVMPQSLITNIVERYS